MMNKCIARLSFSGTMLIIRKSVNQYVITCKVGAYCLICKCGISVLLGKSSKNDQRLMTVISSSKLGFHFNFMII